MIITTKRNIAERKPGTAQSLDEMAQFRGAGIVIEVRSNDHGTLGSPGNPAHAHVFDSSGNREIAEIILTRSPPKKPEDIFYYRMDKIPDGLGKAIVKFAGMPYAGSKHTGLGFTNWQAVVTQWVFFHEK
ncbi:MAG: hypothetical protein LBK66_03170 [Spirochaetaceae bacterium]|jgi:hypothetical protein|nr:hypothetical protein [Spirochaetaceae bacterium]